MAKWIKSVLFGRQLSHGSDNENPSSFSEAFQQQDVEEMEVQQAEQTLVCSYGSIDNLM